MKKHIPGVMLGGFLSGIPMAFIYISETPIPAPPPIPCEMMMAQKHDGPGVIKVCEDAMNPINCENNTLSDMIISPGRYALWLKK